MVNNFFIDLDNAREGERIVREELSKLLPHYKFENVSNNRAYWHKGDIKATDEETGDSVFIEVKQDSRIADTGNVLCEDKVYYYGRGLKDGNMYSSYEIYSIVSTSARRIWFIDFSVLQSIYKKSGTYKQINHFD